MCPLAGLPLLLPLLWTLLPAWAGPCTLLEVDSRITWKARGDRSGQRADHLLLRAEDRRPDCARLRVPDLPHSRLTGLRATVQQAESRALRLGMERLVPTEGGWILHLPELAEGAVLRLDLERDLLEPWTLWAPAWRGAPEWTRLRVKKEGDRLPVDALGPAAWMPAADATGALAQARLIVAPGAQAPARYPADEAPPTEAGSLQSREVELRLEVDATARRVEGEPPAGRSRWTEQLTGSGGALPREVAFPPGAEAGRCGVDGADGAASLTPWGCSFPALAEGSDHSLRWSWEEPRLVLADERCLATPAGPVAHSRLRIAVAGGRVIAEGTGGAILREDEAFIEISAENLQPGQGAPGARFRLAEAGGAPVLPDRAAVLNAMARLAVHASMPEPALPLEFKNLKGDAAAVPEVLRLVRQRARTASLPSRGPLNPRPLTDIKGSGWATPWEQALLLTRYLRQLRLDATPVALRPSSWGLVDGASPGGHDRAAVRLRLDGVERWLDPTCPVCAPGEMAPDLWGAQALAEDIDRIPPPPAATIEGSLSEDGVLDLILNPPAALVLRLALLDSAPEQRGARLPALMGLPGAALLEQEGLGSPGQPVRLRLRLDPAAGPLAWTAGQPLGAAGLLRGPGGTWMPLLGEITLSRPLSGAADARSESVALPGMGWTGRVELQGPDAPRLVERLKLDDRWLAPGQADAFTGHLDAAWARLSAAPPPPEPELP